MALLITPADKAFSDCVRERADFRCERCGRQVDRYDGNARKGLHCSHWIGRGSWGTRFHPLNAYAHCYGCHAYFEGRPALFNDWVMERLGGQAMDALKRLGSAPAYGIKKRKKEIAKHYRMEHRDMLEKRKDGLTGWLSFSISPDIPEIELIDWTHYALQHVS